MRFVTAPALMEYAQNERFRERLGAVTNRTIGVNLRKYLCFYERFSIGMRIETVLYSVLSGRYVYSTPVRHVSLALSERHIRIGAPLL